MGYRKIHEKGLTMRVRTTTTTILLASLLLAGCGGGGGSEGAGTVSVVSGPSTPAPTPTPTPTPTATATIPVVEGTDPMAGYGTACDGFAKSLKAYAVSATIRATHSDLNRNPDGYFYDYAYAEVENFSADLQYVYDAAKRSASTTKAGATVWSFAGTDVVSSTPSTISYRNGWNVLDVVCGSGSAMSFQRFSVDLRNPALGVRESVHRAQLTGVPTARLDETASGTYVVQSLPIETFRISVQDPARRTEAVSNVAPVVLTFDKSAGTIRGTFRTGGSEPLDVTIDISRQIGTRFTGTITASNGAKGEISGGFYGVGAPEIGFVTTFYREGVHYVAAGGGKRG